MQSGVPAKYHGIEGDTARTLISEGLEHGNESNAYSRLPRRHPLPCLPVISQPADAPTEKICASVKELVSSSPVSAEVNTLRSKLPFGLAVGKSWVNAVEDTNRINKANFRTGMQNAGDRDSRRGDAATAPTVLEPQRVRPGGEPALARRSRRRRRAWRRSPARRRR